MTDDQVAAMAVVDPGATVQADVEQLRNAPGAPDTLIISGLVYDVTTGSLDVIVPAAPLRPAASAVEQAP